MNPTRVSTITSAIFVMISSVVLPAKAADVAAGKKTFTTICAACHKLADYNAKSATELQTALKGIVAGKVKHEKKLTLSDSDIDNVVAYIKAPPTK